ncbi:MAG: hypothetical protein N2442_00195 [Spirochaetes bacterium]|nr:hypothetical protein [Spirochaetota bacterium]
MAAGIFQGYEYAAKIIPKQVRKTFHPRSAYRTVYDRRYEVYKELYPRLRDLYNRLNG